MCTIDSWSLNRVLCKQTGSSSTRYQVRTLPQRYGKYLVSSFLPARVLVLHTNYLATLGGSRFYKGDCNESEAKTFALHQLADDDTCFYVDRYCQTVVKYLEYIGESCGTSIRFDTRAKTNPR